MRKSTLILASTTAAFAASTLYLALELHRRSDALLVLGPGDTRLAAARLTPQHTASPVLPDGSLGPATPAPSWAIRAPATPGSPTSTAAEAEVEASLNASYAKQNLARLKDPAQRAAWLANSIARYRRQYAQFRDRNELSDATFEQLLKTFAEDELRMTEKFSGCMADPRCDAEAFGKRNLPEDHSQELLALLGADKLEEFTRFQASVGEREIVAQLRGRLAEGNSLRDDQAEALVTALVEERARIHKEITERGSTVGGWGTDVGTVWFSNDSNSIEQRLAEASQISQRLRHRAEAVLSPAQLAAYNQMQDELLAQMAAFMRPASHGAGKV